MGVFLRGTRTAHTFFPVSPEYKKKTYEIWAQYFFCSPPSIRMCKRVSEKKKYWLFHFFKSQKYECGIGSEKKKRFVWTFLFLLNAHTPQWRLKIVWYSSCSINHGTFDLCKCTSDVWPVVVVAAWIVTVTSTAYFMAQKMLSRSSEFGESQFNCYIVLIFSVNVSFISKYSSQTPKS